MCWCMMSTCAQLFLYHIVICFGVWFAEHSMNFFSSVIGDFRYLFLSLCKSMNQSSMIANFFKAWDFLVLFRQKNSCMFEFPSFLLPTTLRAANAQPISPDGTCVTELRRNLLAPLCTCLKIKFLKYVTTMNPEPGLQSIYARKLQASDTALSVRMRGGVVKRATVKMVPYFPSCPSISLWECPRVQYVWKLPVCEARGHQPRHLCSQGA